MSLLAAEYSLKLSKNIDFELEMSILSHFVMLKSLSVKKIGLPVKLAFILVFTLLVGPILPVEYKAFFYTISLIIKELLVFVLPFIVFSYLFSCFSSFKRGAFIFVVGLLMAVCSSNFFSTLISYSVSLLGGANLVTGQSLNTVGGGQELAALFSLIMPRWIPNSYALFSGFGLGMLASWKSKPWALTLAASCKVLASSLLNRAFIPVVPLFIFGFLLKLQHDGVLGQMVRSFGSLFALIAGLQLTYLTLLYLFASGFNKKLFVNYIKNVFPSAVAGFSTMSSAAAMPLTIQGAELNTKDPEKARVIIPSTVNIHLIGDSLGVPILAFGLMMAWGQGLPNIYEYLVFAGYFVLAKFAVAAVPGGGILVMLPVLEAHLGFTPEMLSIMTALYIMLDPINTAANIIGNGAFAIYFTRIAKWIKKESRS